MGGTHRSHIALHNGVSSVYQLVLHEEFLGIVDLILMHTVKVAHFHWVVHTTLITIDIDKLDLSWGVNWIVVVHVWLLASHHWAIHTLLIFNNHRIVMLATMWRSHLVSLALTLVMVNKEAVRKFRAELAVGGSGDLSFSIPRQNMIWSSKLNSI